MGPIGARLAALAGLFLMPALVVAGAGVMFVVVTIGLAVAAGVLLVRPSVLERLQ